MQAYRVAPADRPPTFGLVPPGASGGTAAEGDGPVATAAAGLRAGRVTSVELVEESLNAVEKHDADLHAVVHLMGESALADAARLDAEAATGRWRGPLHGIPVTVKDVIDVAGVPTRAGSAAFERVPTEDAASVALLRAAGAVILAKVSTHEFALGVTTPQSRNPHDPSRIPGGSSGGSAIAVVTGMGLASLGTDTRASIRVPAALSGVVGFKPTYGTVPTAGVVPLSWTMDHVAPIAATVGDAALMLNALRPTRPIGAVDGRVRIGVPESTFEGAEPGVAAAVRAAIEGLGSVVISVERPSSADLEDANAAGLIVSRCEAAAFHRALGADRSKYWDEVADQLDAAESVTAVDYLDAQRMRAELTEAMLRVFEDCDVLAMPTAPVVAPPVDDFARYLLLLSRNAIPWSLTGLPALSVPCGWSEGLPVGLQLVAAPGREDLLVAVGTAAEAAR